MSAKNPGIVLCGSVGSTRRTLLGLIRNRANVKGVLGLSPKAAGNVAGYCRLDDLAISSGIEYVEFMDVNSSEIAEKAASWKPDLLFVTGLSQIVKPELLKIPRLGCVGFHPTRLPEGRGRAPIAWLVLDGRPGAATFFLMTEGMDDGPILAQKTFAVSDNDYAADVMEKMENAIDAALNGWLPKLIEGEWKYADQDHEKATYTGLRAPEDGLIDWTMAAADIHRLIRAVSRPHPGAFTHVRDCKAIVWRAEIENNASFRGVAGRIVAGGEEDGWVVQTGDGLLRITEMEFSGIGAVTLKIGVKLGYSPQDEIFMLKQRIAKLEKGLA